MASEALTPKLLAVNEDQPAYLQSPVKATATSELRPWDLSGDDWVLVRASIDKRSEEAKEVDGGSDDGETLPLACFRAALIFTIHSPQRNLDPCCRSFAVCDSVGYGKQALTEA